MKKGTSSLLAAIVVLAIVIAGIAMVLRIGMPAIQRARENSLISEAKSNLQLLRRKVESVQYNEKGFSQRIVLSVSSGQYLVKPEKNKIYFSAELTSDLLPAGVCKKTGQLRIKTFGIGRRLDLPFSKGSGNLSKDCSKYENNARLHPNYTAGDTAADLWEDNCKLGKCIQLDGKDDYLNVSDNPSLRPSTFSVESWFKVADKTSESDLLGKYYQANEGWKIKIENGNLTFMLSNGGSWNINLTTSINENRWYHVVGVYNNGTQKSKLYLDGRLVDSATNKIYRPSTQDLTIGRRPYQEEAYFNGTMDEVHLYRWALSSKEVKKRHKFQAIDRANRLQITLEPKGVNLTKQVRLSRGTHSLLLKNEGYDNEKTKIKISLL